MMSCKTKLLSAAVGLAALIATPALAQSYAPEYGTGNVIPNATSQSTANSAFAQAESNCAFIFARADQSPTPRRRF